MAFTVEENQKSRYRLVPRTPLPKPLQAPELHGQPRDSEPTRKEGLGTLSRLSEANIPTIGYQPYLHGRYLKLRSTRANSMVLFTTTVLYLTSKAPTAEVRSSSGRFLGLKAKLLGRHRCGSQTPQPVNSLGFTTAETNQTQPKTMFRTYSSKRSPSKRSSPQTSSLTVSGSGGKAATVDHQEGLSDAKPIRKGDSAPVHLGDAVES